MTNPIPFRVRYAEACRRRDTRDARQKIIQTFDEQFCKHQLERIQQTLRDSERRIKLAWQDAAHRFDAAKCLTTLERRS